MSNPLRARARQIAAFAAALLVAVPLVTTESAAQIFEDDDTSLSSALAGRRLPSAFDGEAVPLEGPLDPQAYLVGPGDVFALTIGGQFPLTLRATVSADGRLIVPDLGSFDAADRPLATVQDELRTALRRLYRNVETDAVLAEPRRFYVHVSGAVIEPGRHVVMPIARVEDALTSAMGGVSPQRVIGLPPTRRAMMLRAMQAINPASFEPDRVQPVEGLVAETRYRPAFRNVLVTHRDGTTERVDLLRYYATGDIDANPYLRDGDTVFLPFYDSATESVGVDGAVPEPGMYDHRPDDTALALLLLALGPDARTHDGTVRLVRSAASGEPRTALLAPSEWAATPLGTGDRLFVFAEADAVGSATVDGAVAFPGQYPIRPGRTTLRELAELAGGLDQNALLRAAYLERLPADGIDREGFDRNRLASNPMLTLDVREAALSESLYEYARRSGLDFSGRLYLTRELLSPRRVSANVADVLQGNAPDVVLRDGDRLVIPVDVGAVAVLGQVTRPGYVPFEPGRTAAYYIAAAGAPTTGATDAYVVDAATGAFSPAADAPPLLPGDLVFVDRIPTGDDRVSQQVIAQERSVALAERREDDDRRFRTLSIVLSAVSTTVTVLFFITSLSGE